MYFICETYVTVGQTACRLFHLSVIGSTNIVVMVFPYLWCAVIVLIFSVLRFLLLLLLFFSCDSVEMVRLKHSNQTPFTQQRVRGEISSVCLFVFVLFFDVTRQMTLKRCSELAK